MTRDTTSCQEALCDKDLEQIKANPALSETNTDLPSTHLKLVILLQSAQVL
jgi:hypothetical protein